MFIHMRNRQNNHARISEEISENILWGIFNEIPEVIHRGITDGVTG